MWASNGASFSRQWDQAQVHQSIGGGATTSWPPGALNGAMWWHEAAYSGWQNQARGTMASAASSQMEAMTQDLNPVHTKFRRGTSLQASTHPQPQAPAKKKEPAGLSFSEVEQRLNRSWEEIVTKDAEHQRAINRDVALRAAAEAPEAPPMPGRLVSSGIVASRDVENAPSLQSDPTYSLFADAGQDKAAPTIHSNSNVFCPFCADGGGRCPFHEKNHWPCAKMEPGSPQANVCEEPPLSHIACDMADQVLDMSEDASTEAGSSDVWCAQSRSDDCSEEGEAVISVGAGVRASSVSSPLLQEGLPVGSCWRQWPVEPRREGGAEARARHQPRAPPPSVPPPPPQATPSPLRQLLAMGFPEVDARRALTRAGTRGVDAAVAILVDGSAA